MKPNRKIFNLEYQIPVYKTFQIDIEKLANLLIEIHNAHNWSLEAELIMDYFGDNVELCLKKLGLPEEVELEHSSVDFIDDYLLEALKEKLQ